MTILLFSGKRVELVQGEFECLQNFKFPVNNKLFPKSINHGHLIVYGENYYISGTIENSEKVFCLMDRLKS